ncbi:uncharacterized protein LOC128261021 [Drosophila gunungcola]|uniref:Seminal fluid protein n=1 Tax=Drosophila gunungcola TaxID=103775 RepID=A0A9P9YDR7_9MUSC|nr:uncharacterized protein LOC128261021 [Drosophila gunungcola]KAI8035081.1 hypothetical protein M5D96_012174 [Drosophila gunungcola]
MKGQGVLVRWLGLLAVVLATGIRQLSTGISPNERRFQCLQPRIVGQTNCSPCAELYIFNRSSGHRRCEHVNGRCYPQRTVFATARLCEIICQPYIQRATLHEKTTPVPPIVQPYFDSDEEFQ